MVGLEKIAKYSENKELLNTRLEGDFCTGLINIPTWKIYGPKSHLNYVLIFSFKMFYNTLVYKKIIRSGILV